MQPLARVPGFPATRRRPRTDNLKMLVDPDLVWFVGAVVVLGAPMLVVAVVGTRLKERSGRYHKQR